MKTSMQINFIKNGKSTSKSYTDISSAATNAQLVDFAQGITNLTSNIYSGTKRIEVIDADTEPGGGIKPTPTLSMSVTSMSAAALDSAQYTDNGIDIVTNSDGEIATSLSGFDSAIGSTIPTVAVLNKKLYLHKAVFSNKTATGTIHVTVLPSANYGISNTIDFTITA